MSTFAASLQMSSFLTSYTLKSNYIHDCRAL